MRIFSHIPIRSFDIVYCHFLLLWVNDPLQVVREMARVGQSVLALAEPDYSQRVDEPAALKPLGEWQTEALTKAGSKSILRREAGRDFLSGWDQADRNRTHSRRKQ